jgi:hypothetical protein
MSRTPSTPASPAIEAFWIEKNLHLKNRFLTTSSPLNNFDATQHFTRQQEKIIRPWPWQDANGWFLTKMLKLTMARLA